MRSLASLLAILPLAVGAAERVGPETCKACHPVAYDAWHEGPHARGTERLPEPSRRDARCIACHAPDQDKGISGVSCEACHGPGQIYAASYVMRDPELARAVGLRQPTEKTCLVCHTDSAPSLTRFEFARKLPLIDHWTGERSEGRKKPSSGAASKESRPPLPREH